MGSQFIVIEGIDGSGISTQVEMLRVWCEKNNVDVFVTKEPSDGPIGAQLKSALTNRVEYSPHTMALLFAADRVDHLEHDILPRLDTGVTVVSDRYYLSSFAYQSEGVELQWLREINSTCPRPDLTVFLDVPVKDCLERWSTDVWRSQDRLQLYEDEAILTRVRERFLKTIDQLKDEGERIEIVDATGRIKEVGDALASFVQPLVASNPGKPGVANATSASQEIESMLSVPPGSRS